MEERKRKVPCGGREFCIILILVIVVCLGLLLSFYFTTGFGLIRGKLFKYSEFRIKNCRKQCIIIGCPLLIFTDHRIENFSYFCFLGRRREMCIRNKLSSYRDLYPLFNKSLQKHMTQSVQSLSTKWNEMLSIRLSFLIKMPYHQH